MILLTPGPTPVPESIRQAMATPTIHHRTPEFEAIFASTRTKLLDLFNMPEVLMLGSSGTGAMEAAVTNLCNTKILTIAAGKFGQRFGKIAKAHGLENIELSYEWNEPAKIADINKVLDENPDIDAIAIQISESAGGLRHPVESIAKIAKAKNPNIMIIADGITAVGVEKIDTSYIDALIAGSQKAFMLPPGLAMLGLSDAAVTKINNGGAKGFYFNLSSEIKSQRKNTTAYTAVTTLIIGLGAILDEIYEGGLENLYHTTQKRHIATMGALTALDMLIYPNSPSLAMTTISMDNSDALRKILKTKYGVNIAGGQDHLKNQIFRINNMGLIKEYEALWVVNAIELALDEMGLRKFDGSASKTFNELFFGVNR
jgi:aspartate aminotransferase-like enzyme